MAMQLAAGTITAGDTDVIITPRLLTSRRAVILCHGAGNGAVVSWASITTNPSMFALGQAVGRAGFRAYGGDLGGLQTWGNDTEIAAVEAARLYLVSKGAAADKILLIGLSMGNFSALNYARANPGKVAAVIGIMPASNMDDIRDNNRLGSRDLINTAWGLAAGSTSATVALPARANPLGAANIAAIASGGFPIRYFYSSADTVVLPGTVAALTAALVAAGVDATATQVSTSLDHSDAIVGQVATSTVTDFLATYR